MAARVRSMGASWPWRMKTMPLDAPVANPAMMQPSMSVKGSDSRIVLSLKAPGSPSSALHRMYFSEAGLPARNPHFTPVGNAAPPRPRSPESLTSWSTRSGSSSQTARSNPAKPPRATYWSMSAGSISPALRSAIRCWRRIIGRSSRRGSPGWSESTVASASSTTGLPFLM